MASSAQEEHVRFGPFELDLRSRELRHGSTLVRLQDQPFEILSMLLERPGRVVTREELRQRLWPEGTFVDFEHSLNAAVKRLRAALGDDASHPHFVETLPRRGYRFIGPMDSRRQAPDSPAEARPKLAVLPFANLAEQAGQEYFTDGLTEEMIAQLGRLCRGHLGVIARWSSMTFRDGHQRAGDVGLALGAQYLLEGSVRREADRVRITARLVDAASETQLWADTYERHLTDCLSVQTDVAARIAESLAVELVPNGRPETSNSVASANAYQAYLQARYYWNMESDEGLEQAVAHYREALRLDSGFAPAHAGLARAHVARAETYREQPRRSLEAARTTVKHALDADPGLSEAHLALADVRRMLEWDWRGAENSYAHAIALNPSQENAHRGCAVLLAALSRSEEAMREAERSCELDPLCLLVRATAGWVCYLAGDCEAAIRHCRRSLDMDPQHTVSRRVLGAALLQNGRSAEALDVFAAARLASRHDSVLTAWLAHAMAVGGDRVGGETLLAELSSLGRRRYVSPYHLALVETGLGRHDLAFAALEQAVVDADPALSAIGVEPRFDPIRGDARYGRLLELLGL